MVKVVNTNNWFMLLVIFTCSLACSNPLINPTKSTIKIGFSQAMSDDLWRQNMNSEMRQVAAIYPNVELIIRDGDTNNEKQIQDINDFIEEGVDVLIISPNESEPLEPVITKAFQAGIPVILLDRGIKTDKYTTYIAGDNYQIGQLAAQYAKQLLPNGGVILEISGLKGSTPAQERHQGFIDGFNWDDNSDNKQDEAYTIIDAGDGGWIKSKTKEVVIDDFDSNQSIDLVFAHNDVSALAAYEVAKERNRHKEIFFIGVDALPVQNGGVDYVKRGILTASLLYPTGGKQAINAALDILDNKSLPKKIILSTSVIDKDNADIFLLQNNRLEEQQDLIEQQQFILGQQILRFENQRSWVIVLTTVLIGLLIASFYLYRANKYIARINKHLEMKNSSISRQKEEIEKMSERIEQYSKEKIDFFTFISHELRTPITILLSLLHRVKELSYKISRDEVEIISKNVNRLHHLVEQVLDFRKYEEQKISFDEEPLYVIDVITPIIESFRKVTGYDIQIEMPSDSDKAILFDKDKLEKIVSNLVSNAIKFSPDYTTVLVKLSLDKSILNMHVIDRGVGISEDKIEQIYNPFFSTKSDNNYYYSKGTGIGLSLVKQIIELYKGSISLTSKEGEGSTFSISIPVKIIEDNQSVPRFIQSEFTSGIKSHFDNGNGVTHNSTPLVEALLKSKKEKSPRILILEDDTDLNSELVKIFTNEGYITKSNENGLNVTEVVSEFKPDIVLADLVMPEVDGLEVARLLKKNESHASIPIVLVTAMADVELMKQGFVAGIDDYILKPFNPDILRDKVNNIIDTRRKFKKLLISETNSWLVRDIDSQSSDQQSFLLSFRDLVEKSLSDPEFNVHSLANSLNMSRVTLYNKVKQMFNCSPVEIIQRYRIERAKLLLVETEYNISEISYKSGFQNTSYFSKVFKSIEGLTPSEYLQRHRKLSIS